MSKTLLSLAVIAVSVCGASAAQLEALWAAAATQFSAGAPPFQRVARSPRVPVVKITGISEISSLY